ncbi:hypothetical protein [Nostoc sp.]|uniref:hypothetical protein n=1 Tax=Nostoc sp. TaxID=1180 RepID=UPI002FF91210
MSIGRAIYRTIVTQLNLVVSINSQAIAAILIDQLYQLSKDTPLSYYQNFG